MTSLSPDRSPDPCHLTGRSPDILSHDLPHCSYCLLSHSLLSTIYGDSIVSGPLSYLPLFSPVIVFVSIVPKALLFVLLRHLVMVAASVVYKPSLYCRRGLKPDLVSNPSVVASQTFLVCFLLFPLSHLSLGCLKIPLSRTESATSRIQRIPNLSPSKAAPKPKYSYMVESTLQPHDPGKPSHDISTTLGLYDIQACDPGKVSHDLPRDWSSI